MNRDRTSSSNDPTAESGSGVERDRDVDEDVVNRTGENTTPRRYEQPLEEDEPVMPADDATLNTKI